MQYSFLSGFKDHIIRFLSIYRQLISLEPLTLSRRIEHGATEDVIDYVVFRLRQITHRMLRLGGVANLSEEVHNNLLNVTMLLNEVEYEHIRPAVPLIRQQGFRGRPHFEISLEQLEYFVSYDFSFVDIAKALGVHLVPSIDMLENMEFQLGKDKLL